MRDIFSRTPAGGDDTPLDASQVRRDDALIEALRSDLLFPDSPTAPLRSVADLPDPGHLEHFGHVEHFDEDDFDSFVRAAGEPSGLRDRSTADADAQVSALLRAWRGEIDAVPLPPPVDTRIAAAIVGAAPARRRSVRPMIAVAAAIAGLLMGSTAIGARSATPDDTLLWPVTELLWGDRVEEVLASIDARQGIDQASKAIDAGHPDQAEAALKGVTVVITRVEDSSERATLESDLGRVQSKLESSRATPSAPPPVGTTPTGPTTISASPLPSTTGPSVPVAPPPDVTAPPASSDEVAPPSGTSGDAPSTSDPEVPVEPSVTDPTSVDLTTPATPTEDTSTTPTSDDDLPSPSGIRPDDGPAGGGSSAAEPSAN